MQMILKIKKKINKKFEIWQNKKQQQQQRQRQEKIKRQSATLWYKVNMPNPWKTDKKWGGRTKPLGHLQGSLAVIFDIWRIKSPSNMLSILKYTQKLFRRRRKSCRYRCELFLITVTSLILLSAVGAKFYLFAGFFFKFYLFPPWKTLLCTYHHFKARNISYFSYLSPLFWSSRSFS